MKNSSILWIVVVLLSLLLATNMFSLAERQLTKVADEERAEAYLVLADSQRTIILETMSDYEETAYGPKVDRIAEQQLIAEEFQLAVLHILAIQNSQIIELLVAAP